MRAKTIHYIMIGILVVVIIFIISTKSKDDTQPEAQVIWDEAVQITKDIEVNTVGFTTDSKLQFTGGDNIYVSNVDGTEIRTLFEYQGVRRSQMSPDRSTIVLDNDLDIYVANADGSDLTAVANDSDLLEFAVSFTPDGQAITYVTIDNINSEYGIWKMDPDGNNKRNIFDSTLDIFRHPRQNPDGNKISYFTTGKDKQPTIYVMNSDGTNSTALTNPSDDGPSRQASWSPDGQQIVYSSKQSGDFNLWIMDADGQNKKQITSIPGDEAKPVWSSDSKMIVFLCSDCFGTLGSDIYTIQLLND